MRSNWRTFVRFKMTCFAFFCIMKLMAVAVRHLSNAIYTCYHCANDVLNPFACPDDFINTYIYEKSLIGWPESQVFWTKKTGLATGVAILSN
jgi:hypothetical protein